MDKRIRDGRRTVGNILGSRKRPDNGAMSAPPPRPESTPSRSGTDRWVERTRRRLLVRGYSARTRDVYASWVRRFLNAGHGVACTSLTRGHVERFIDRLAIVERLAPKTLNQASSALSFFFREVLGSDELAGMPRAREPERVPSVLSHRQVMIVLGGLSGKYRLLGSLMYGCGLRLTEAHRIRIKDLDFDLAQITVRDGKGAKDRWVMLPERLVRPLHRQIARVRELHVRDRGEKGGWARLPHALARKDREAGHQLVWQFLFPASRPSRDPVTGRLGRSHLNPTAMQRHVKRAAKASGVPKPVTCHTFRRSFATQMLRAGYDVRSVQKLMGHRDVRTTMIYVQAITDAGVGMRSPLDQPDRD